MPGYGALRGGRDYQNTDFSLRDLQERYLPPFQAAIDAGVGSVMCSYTSYNGEPLTMNRFMNHDILRGQMGFTGLLCLTGLLLIMRLLKELQLMVKKLPGRGMNSGIDMDMSSRQYSRHLKKLVEEKVVSEKTIDEAVRRALALKFEMGLFDDPYRYFDTIREQQILFSERNPGIGLSFDNCHYGVVKK